MMTMMMTIHRLQMTNLRPSLHRKNSSEYTLFLLRPPSFFPLRPYKGGGGGWGRKGEGVMKGRTGLLSVETIREKKLSMQGKTPERRNKGHFFFIAWQWRCKNFWLGWQVFRAYRTSPTQLILFSDFTFWNTKGFECNSMGSNLIMYHLMISCYLLRTITF